MRTDQAALRQTLATHGIVPSTFLASRPFSECFRGEYGPKSLPVFIKVLDSLEPKIRLNFSREVTVLRALSGNPGYPVLHAYSPPVTAGDRFPFHACGYIAAPCLYETSRLPDAEGLLPVLRSARTLAAWIRDLHGRGYAHRDLSPDHVFATGERSVTVVDFGMAKPTRALPDSERNLCEGYDIQAFGMILWELVCGRPLFPYRSPDLPACLLAQIALLRDVPIPAPLTRLITACLCVHSEFTTEGLLRNDGWQTAEDLHRAMSGLID